MYSERLKETERQGIEHGLIKERFSVSFFSVLISLIGLIGKSAIFRLIDMKSVTL